MTNPNRAALTANESEVMSLIAIASQMYSGGTAYTSDILSGKSAAERRAIGGTLTSLCEKGYIRLESLPSDEGGGVIIWVIP